MATNSNTVRRALDLLGKESAEECSWETFCDAITDLLVVAADAGHDWRDLLASAEMHANAEIDGKELP